MSVRLVGRLLKDYNDESNGSVAAPFAIPYRISDFGATFREGSLTLKSVAWSEQGAVAMTGPRVHTALRVARRMSRIRSTLAWRLIGRCRSAVKKLAGKLSPAR